MILSVEIGGREYEFDASAPHHLAIPLAFDGPQPNAYGVEKAAARACEAGALVGDTRRGGSCNFEEYRLIAHCNGTHTECVGHITHERIAVHDCLADALFPAALVSVAPEKAGESAEGDGGAPAAPDDPLITRRALEAAFRPFADAGFPFEALVVRTLPNDAAKRARLYLDAIPPYFSAAAIEWIVARGVRHLVVDLPSIDRLFDAGRLANHRAFWRVAPGSFETAGDSRTNATITELAFVPDAAADGFYLLNLQIAPFAADAAPSRPVLFPAR